MATAANSPFVKHPALLALFAPRPPPIFKAPMSSKSTTKLTGIAAFTEHFGKSEGEVAPTITESPSQRKARLAAEKRERHQKTLAEREKNWDPHSNAQATKDPYKTLFVARLSYEVTEEDLRREFERYGRIRDVKLIVEKESSKSRGYAFIEFERSNDLKEAFQHADGLKLNGRRILVDVERGRTVKTWKPRKLGGGLGKTRAGKSAQTPGGLGSGGGGLARGRGMGGGSSRDHRDHRDRDRHRDKYASRRDKYRDRDHRDRKRERKRSRSRSRDRKDKKRSRDKDRRDRDRDRERDRGRDKDRGEGERERERDRPRRSRDSRRSSRDERRRH